jgi:dTDP-4-amino-4,6-dideoxygalactose transaminase
MLPLFKVFMAADAGDAVKETLNSGFIGQGMKVASFEYALQLYFNSPWVLTTNSCTSALHLAYLFAEPGEALCPPLTCLATSAALKQAGHTVKWVDIETNGNINLVDLAVKLTKHTKLVVVVHFAGNPVDLNQLDSILDKHRDKYGYRPIVVEDCAHAIGSRYDGHKIGTTFGHICCFSFQAVKTLTTGDGGCINLDSQIAYDVTKRRRWFGLSRDCSIFEQDVTELGYKYNMNDINATIGLSNIVHLDRLVEKQRGNYHFYRDKIPEISVAQCGEPNGWLYPVWVDDRVSFEKMMAEHGIQCGPAHCRNDIYSCHSKADLPIMELAEKHLTCIPCGWWIEDNDRQYIVDCIMKG